MSLFEVFNRQPRYSRKLNTYFPIYEEQFARFVGKAITFVEIGVQHGGSLSMWREYLGPQARIIGIDLNPEMKQLEADGFHIEIGDQASPAFWRNFFTKVGSIDVLLDDGGHSNEQQIVTVYCALDHIRDGGVILIEDVHASYLERFGNPSPRSFVNWCKNQIDMINQRFDEVEKLSLNPLAERFRDIVHSISFYDSIVAIRVDRTLAKPSTIVANSGPKLAAQLLPGGDPKACAHLAVSEIEGRLRRRFRLLKHVPFVETLTRQVFAVVRKVNAYRVMRKSHRALDRYF
jgi:hypothetical protein